MRHLWLSLLLVLPCTACDDDDASELQVLAQDPYTTPLGVEGRKGRPTEEQSAAILKPCRGDDGRLSVMAVGAEGCVVTVGRTKLGLAPFFRTHAPSGSCEITVICDDGRHYGTVRELRSGRNEQLIIKQDDWTL